MKVGTIPPGSVADALRRLTYMVVPGMLLASLSQAAAQQYPPPGYSGQGQPPAYPNPGQPPAYPGPAQPPAYPGPGYGGPTGAPPPLQREAVPPPPGGGMVWTPGYWNWGHRGWVWMPGRYVARPYPHAAWVPGHWRPRGPSWVWIPGHWRR
jgi:WXXGXW repeat (2 copies)